MTDKFKKANRLMESSTSWSTRLYEYGGDDVDIVFSEYHGYHDDASHDNGKTKRNNDIMKTDDREDDERNDNDMSFVGIIVMNDGLIAFGDSKGSLRDMNGKFYEDMGRQVQKVFWYGKKMLVTHGINQIKLHDDRMCNLEDYINDCIDNEMSLDDMLEGIHESRSVMCDRCIYQFMTGEISHGRKITEDIRVAKENIICNKAVHYEKDNPCCLYSNVAPYSEGVSRLMEKFRSNGIYTVDEANVRFRAWLEARIKAEEMESKYTSVGMPIVIETLKIK